MLSWTARFPASNADSSSFRAKSLPLPCPSPDIVIGFRRRESVATTAEPPFYLHWEEHKHVNGRALLLLQNDLDGQLHPGPAPTQPLVYPCFVQEIKAQPGNSFGAANQLAESLVFALDQQEELRVLAGAPENERMPVFGAVSIGLEFKLWCGAYVGGRIVSLPPQTSCHSLIISSHHSTLLTGTNLLK
mgnify:CR=1 FL=1